MLCTCDPVYLILMHPFILPASSHSSLNGKGQARSSPILILHSLSWVLGFQPLNPNPKSHSSVSLLKTTLPKKAPGGLLGTSFVVFRLTLSTTAQPAHTDISLVLFSSFLLPGLDCCCPDLSHWLCSGYPGCPPSPPSSLLPISGSF